MCGIFGIINNDSAGLTATRVEATITSLLTLAESRGKEAAGLAFLDDEKIRVYKKSLAGTAMLRLDECRELFRSTDGEPGNRNGGEATAVIGHSRLVTNGALQVGDNNQPVITDDIVGIHNGIIVNDEALWQAHPHLKRELRLDTEVLFRLIAHFSAESGSLVTGVRQAFSHIQGVANIALFPGNHNQVLLATNNGSLYIASNAARSAHLFASEEYILEKCLKAQHLEHLLGEVEIKQVRPGTGRLIDLPSMTLQDFSLDPGCTTSPPVELPGAKRRIESIASHVEDDHELTILAEPAGAKAPSWFIKEYERNTEAIDAIRRCTQCVLPETVPALDFDEAGVCSDCRSFKPVQYKGHAALEEAIAPFRRTDGKPDCLLPLSGGRDSCYTLHYAKQELGLNPIAFTYDWGMVTDLARRNQMRLCGKLGIEHILVSADLAWKRRNIKRNVEAWLAKPAMGIIPLFMAGDKQFFYHADQLRKRHDLKITLFAMNWLEDTDFKTGYCGVPRGLGADFPGADSNLRMIWYYARTFLTNPRYLNPSLLDTLWAYFIYYLSPIHQSYLTFCDYIPWDEESIISTLRDEYDWELAPDTNATWRIGDGTAAFYNYLYYTVGGFTEIDTFRSNQVRAGMLTRDRALALVRQENNHRYESMAWYSETIGIDLDSAIHKINTIPKRYPMS